MDRLDMIKQLNEMLLKDMPSVKAQAYKFPKDEENQRRLLRSLMNIRPPMPLQPDFLILQDKLLSDERDQKGIVDVMALTSVHKETRIAIWQGDITRINADAIVNAGNSDLLGCFCPCHGCIDNAIHSAAGLQLREQCNQIMQKQGHKEFNGKAKLTKGYNLPARYVIHTVGPIVYGGVTARNRYELASCYRSCLELAEQNGLKSLAFCCISTGEYHFPNREAAEIAVMTVQEFLQKNTSLRKVVFNVFKDVDDKIYRDLFGED